MSERLQQIADQFALADNELRLQLLLDYARKLPPLPGRFHAERDAGLHRVPECMTPVFLWVEREGHSLRLFLDVAEEAPTVKGLMSIILTAYDAAPPAEVAHMPEDMLNRLHLNEVIRMQRAIGFSGILGRIKREAQALTAEEPDAARSNGVSGS